jgi:hypothetical protein
MPAKDRRGLRVSIAIAVGLTILFAFPPAIRAQTIQWTRQFGTTATDEVYGVAVDATGVYLVGDTVGTLPGQTSAGGSDAFVRKYDADGTELWTRQFGTTSYDYAFGVAVDAGGVYVVGGADDAFVRKYDADGTEQWTRQFGTVKFDYALGVAVDATGVYVAGYTYGALPGQVNAGGADAFVRKYDVNGNVVWTHQFGTSSNEPASAVAVNATGVYMAGYTDGVLPGQVSTGGTDAFVRKYDVDGNVVWTRQFGTASSDSASGVAVDATGVNVVGSTSGTLPGQTSAGGTDAFARKYDVNGDVLWTRQFGTASSDSASGVAVNGSGVDVAGYTEGALPPQVSAGGIDAFVRKYDASGTELWTLQFGSANSDAALGVTVDATGVYVGGVTDGTLPGQASGGGVDAFVISLEPTGPPPPHPARRGQLISD